MGRARGTPLSSGTRAEMGRHAKSAIAIVGMACHYPDAASPAELFENVLAGRRAFRRIPDERLPLDEYGSSDPEDVDRTYVTQAALIEGYAFDRLRFKIVGSTYRSADLTHWLALDVAERALCDAGFEGGAGLPREQTGVLLGNTLTGEFSRAQALRLRWPYVRALLADELAGVIGDEVERASLLERLEARFKAPFEPFGDESLAGGLANTIAGRICNFFDLKGGGYTVDGACASSLLAVDHACAALEREDLEVAIAGGVDISLDPFELVGFSRAGALARNEMRVYEQRSEGFWPGEGCGMLVLMRERDALTEGRHIYARICGRGISSDGAGGISRPEQEGQLLAMRRAYARSGFGPESVGYFEGHGTGTPVGDSTELGALTRLLEESGSSTHEPAMIGSVKANIGHTKAAAGVAGLIKAAMALHEQVVPPMPGCERPHPLVDPAQGARLRVPSRGCGWPESRALRAGVSSMGFGGINTHVVLDAEPESRRSVLSKRHEALLCSAQEAELFVLGAASRAQLAQQIDAVRARAAQLSRAELTDLAASLAAQASTATELRAAVIASRPDELSARLAILSDWLAELEEPDCQLAPERGLFLGAGSGSPRIGFLFPGQGAPVYPDLGDFGRRTGMRSSYAGDLESVPRGDVVDTSLAQPNIVSATLASAEALAAMGVEAVVGVGHSVGEIAALAWGSVISSEEAVALAKRRGHIMSELCESGGAMASLAASPEETRLLMKGLPCTLAAHNGPRRCVVAGPKDAVERILARAAEAGVSGQTLAVSHAFHSPMVAPAIPALAQALTAFTFEAPRRPIVSTRTGALITASDDLRAHLVAQLSEPVRFADAVSQASDEVDLFIELGPGRMLASLVHEFLDTPTISLDAGGPGLRGLLGALGAAYALGAPVRWQTLFAGRCAKPFDLGRAPRFFENPCARIAGASGASGAEVPDAAAPERAAGAGELPASTLEVLIERVAIRCELPVEAIGGGDRFLSDLHLTSIAVSAIAAEAARALSRPPLVAPNEFADATLAELADAIDSDERTLAVAQGVSGVDAWLRAFEVTSVERARPRAGAHEKATAEPSEWQVFTRAGAAERGLVEDMASALRERAGLAGVLVYLGGDERPGDECIAELLAGAKAALHAMEARLFVLVHHGHPGVALVRTLHQEARSLATRIVALTAHTPDLRREAPGWVVEEARSASEFVECRYDARGRRSERSLRVLPLQTGAKSVEPAALPLGRDDVLLVTGGGKGIAAECALALAKESGCALGILGRSAPEGNAELAANLARFTAVGVRVAYAAADVAESAALSRAIDTLEVKLGSVSALLHGAGVNTPHSLVALCEEDFLHTLAPKVRGLENLFARLAGDRLRCVVGFGSIIAQIGLPGEADYGYANELLARHIEAYAAEHPETRALCLEWSIWSGVGMGERLGRVEALAAQNISAISPDLGVAWLRALLARDDLPVRVILSGRIGSPPTLRGVEVEIPILRYLERVREHTPGVELIADAELSFQSDPYLADHVYGGEALLPGVLGLEAMAQAASVLCDTQSAPCFDAVTFLQPIAVPRDGKCVLRSAALLREDGSVEVVLRCDASDFQLNHMRATLRFGEDVDAACALPGGWPAGPAPALDPRRELYGDLFFHRGRFERVQRYASLGARACEVEIASRDEDFFGAFQSQRLLLGDPGARDAAIHAIQACVPERDLLPVGVERIECGEWTCARDGETQLRLRARERHHEGDTYTYDLELRDTAGRLVERWWGLQLRVVGGAAPRTVWPPGLIAPHIESLARDHLPESGLVAALVPGADEKASERALSLASHACVKLRRRADGKPCLEGSEVSSSHAQGHTLGVVAHQPVACDMETVEARDPGIWRDLLGQVRFRLAQQLSERLGEEFDLCATRVWGAGECLKKRGLQRETPLTLRLVNGSALAELEAGSASILSLVVQLRDAERPAVITLLAPAPARGSRAQL